VYRSNPAVENVVCFKAAPINAGAFYKNQIDKGIRNLCRGSLRFFDPGSLRTARSGAKVFWFFFSKKNFFYLPKAITL
jgi:hypothetical protein